MPMLTIARKIHAITSTNSVGATDEMPRIYALQKYAFTQLLSRRR